IGRPDKVCFAKHLDKADHAGTTGTLVRRRATDHGATGLPCFEVWIVAKEARPAPKWEVEVAFGGYATFAPRWPSSVFYLRRKTQNLSGSGFANGRHAPHR